MKKRVLAVATLFLMSIAAAWAETPILSAPDAKQQIEAGELILLDIRTPQEWRETGLAKGAWPVSMHSRDFGTRLQAILAVYPPEQIALICAVGGRTGRVTAILEQNGIAGIVDVSEGMMGNRRGPGWIKRGLDVVTLDEAQAAYDDASANW
ncbi:MAG: rhodanese-like domain-containing protein [Silicimonas sp.]|nr:rhodanese-like domain-containing protein [Silicimonas sp.]